MVKCEVGTFGSSYLGLLPVVVRDGDEADRLWGFRDWEYENLQQGSFD